MEDNGIEDTMLHSKINMYYPTRQAKPIGLKK